MLGVVWRKGVGQDLCCAALCNFADIARQVTTRLLDGAALVLC